MRKSAETICFNLQGKEIPGVDRSIFHEPLKEGIAAASWMLASNGPEGRIEKRGAVAGLLPQATDENYDLNYAIKKAGEATTRSTRDYWTKKASDLMGHSNDMELETAIFTLSSHYIKEKASKLFDLNYFVGFRILDKNEDNTKVVGVYGFKVGSAWAYIPIFFDKGKINGFELLYIQTKDQFVPLKEGWVDWLIKEGGDSVFGSCNSKDFRQLGIRYPDMRQLTQPPALGKVANFESWLQPAIIGMAKHAAAEIPKLNINLEKIASADARIFTRLAYACDQYPIMKVAMDSFYGEEFFAKTFEKLSNAFNKIATAKKATKYQLRTPKNAAVRVITQDDTAAFPFLSEKQAAELISLGNLTIDDREDDEIAIVEDEMQFESPADTGVYDVFFADGSIRECLVIINPWFVKERPSRDLCLVVDWKRKYTIYAKKAAVLTVRGSGKQDWFNRLPAEQFKGATSMRNSEAKDCRGRIIVTPCGCGTIPLDASNADGVWHINPWRDQQDNRRDISYDMKNEGTEITLSRLHDLFIANNRDYNTQREGDDVKGELPKWVICSPTFAGNKMVFRDGKLVLPKIFKYIDIDPYKHSQGDVTALALATENDIVQLLQTNRRKLKVARVDKTYLINRVAHDKVAAFKKLVLDYSFRDKTAREILAAVDLLPNQTLDIPYREPLHKVAELPIDLIGRGGGGLLSEIPEHILPAMFSDPPIAADSYSGIPIQGDMSEAQQLGYEDQPVPPDWLQEVPPPDPMALQGAMDAASTGNKDIFDVSTLLSLIGARRTEDLVGDYSKIFKASLDRIGRTLFLLFSDRTKFEDKFGDDDVVKLETTLLDVWEVLGDLVLFLLQRDNTPEMAGLLESVGDLDGF